MSVNYISQNHTAEDQWRRLRETVSNWWLGYTFWHNRHLAAGMLIGLHARRAQAATTVRLR